MKKILTPFPDFKLDRPGTKRIFNAQLKKYYQDRNIPEKVFYVNYFREEIFHESVSSLMVKAHGPSGKLFYTTDGNRKENVFRTKREAEKELIEFLESEIYMKERALNQIKEKVKELKNKIEALKK